MSAAQNPLGWILDEWANSFSVAITAFGGPHVTVERSGESASASPEDMVWWEQEISLAPGPSIWIGIPIGAWKELGLRSLESLGISSPESAEIEETSTEMLAQSLSGLATRFTELCGSEVVCGQRRLLSAAPAMPSQASLVSLGIGDDSPGDIHFCASGELIQACGTALEAHEHYGDVPAAGTSAAHDPESDQAATLSSMVYLNLPVSLSFGRVYLTLEETLSLAKGVIVPLNRAADAFGELKVNRRTIARGPIVESSGYYGITLDNFSGGETTAKGRPVLGPAV